MRSQFADRGYRPTAAVRGDQDFRDIRHADIIQKQTMVSQYLIAISYLAMRVAHRIDEYSSR